MQHVEDKVLIRRLYRSAIALVLVLAVGSCGYPLIVPGVSWFDGLYMTFLTITTIGFHEVVNMEGHMAGRVFTIFLGITGIGILTYGFSNLAALVIEADLTRTLKRKKLERIIKTMENHYIICGASHVGLHVADELEQTRRPFILVDLSEDLVGELSEEYQVGKVIQGDCTDSDFLESIGIEKARGAFVTTRDDHLNIVICVTLRQLNPRLRIVSHSKDPDSDKKLLSVGADRVISPSYIGALRMASEMVRPTVTGFLDEMLRDKNRNLRIEELQVPSSYAGKTIADVPLEGLQYSLILAVKENGEWLYNPDNAHPLKAHARLIVMTSPEELSALKGKLH